MILVDTNWIIDALRGTPAAVGLIESVSPRGLAISLISYGELYEGAYYARDREGSLAGLHAFLDGKELLPVTAAVAARFAVVRGGLSRQLRQQTGDMDLLIAATALTHDLTLLTRTCATSGTSPT